MSYPGMRIVTSCMGGYNKGRFGSDSGYTIVLLGC
jgi:hypothetical protein